MSAGTDAIDAYLAKLPAGLASFPECQMKGSVVRAFLDGLPRGAFHDLPPSLRALVDAPPLPGQWVNEVHAAALFTYAASQILVSAEEYERHVHDTNFALLDSLTYRVLFRLVGVSRLIDQTAARWSHFHRGTALTVVDRLADHHGATLALDSPPHHVPPALATAYQGAFVAVLEVAGERDVKVEPVVIDPRTLHLRCTWA